MKYVQIDNTFIGLSGALFSVEALNHNGSELKIYGQDTNNCIVAFTLVGTQADITAQIAAFLNSNKKLLVLYGTE